MPTYRVGSHHGVTICREGDGHTCVRPGRGHLVAVVTNDNWELAENIADRLNWPTPDVTHTNGAREALAEVGRRMAQALPSVKLEEIRLILRDAAAELGVDEEAPTTKELP